MKVLVTGGGGFIGSHVVGELLRRGHEVVVYDIVANPVIKHVDATYIYGTILDKHTLCKHLVGCDAVVHLAALLGVKRVAQEQLRCLSINIEGTMNLLDACVMQKVPYVLFTSSSEIYGESLSNGNVQTVCEESPWNPKSNYAITKLVGEKYITAFHDEYGIDYNIIRYFNVYGPGQVDEFVVPRFIKMAMTGESPTVYGSGDQVRSFCYIEDAVKGTVSVLENKATRNQVFNIGNDKEPITMRKLASKVCSKYGEHIEPIHVEFASSDRSSQREIYYRVPCIDKARSLLGYKPGTPLDAGIEKIIEHGGVRSR